MSVVGGPGDRPAPPTTLDAICFPEAIMLSLNHVGLATLSMVLVVSSGLASGKNAFAVVVATVDRSAEYRVSRFEIGATFVGDKTPAWPYGNATAVARAKQLLVDAKVRYNNSFIMGFGLLNPEPSPGVYDFFHADYRQDFISSIPGAIPVITFYTAPGWMKTSGEDWDMESPVAASHYQDFASLCTTIARRYPQVKHFQIWTEQKGFLGNPNGYITMYNTVYDSLRAARPDAIIAGPYTGGCKLDVISSWLSQKHSGDVVCWDDSLEPWPFVNPSDEALQMTRTNTFGLEAQSVRALTDLPMWVSEMYTGGTDGTSTNDAYICANAASCYYNSLINDVSLAMLWGQDHCLFSSTAYEWGGQPTALYGVVKTFNTNFGPGTQLYQTTCSDVNNLDVLASATKTLLINKRPTPISVDLNGTALELAGYEVRLLTIPEPNTLILLGIGISAALVWTWKKRR